MTFSKIPKYQKYDIFDIFDIFNIFQKMHSLNTLQETVVCGLFFKRNKILSSLKFLWRIMRIAAASSTPVGLYSSADTIG